MDVHGLDRRHGVPHAACAAFVAHDPAFAAVAGPHPTLDLLVEFAAYPFAHEAGVFFAARDELFVTSNRFVAPGSVDQQQQEVRISRVALQRDGAGRVVAAERTELAAASAAVPTGNGGVNFRWAFGREEEEDAVLLCAQGSRARPSGLYAMQARPPHAVAPVLTGFYGRRPFNSVNDVVVHPADGALWFTDPPYGFEQGYRGRPQMPSQVYRYDVRGVASGSGSDSGPRPGSLRAVADGFGHPNGLCFAPDLRTLYVTDTDALHGSGTVDPARAASIYAFDVVERHGQPFLTNRRLFAVADTGIPDGIKCDLAGNVYSGCGDGVHVWSPGGVLLGRIVVDGGAANFCFGRGGEVFVLNETRLWRATLGEGVKGALLGI